MGRNLPLRKVASRDCRVEITGRKVTIRERGRQRRNVLVQNILLPCNMRAPLSLQYALRLDDMRPYTRLRAATCLACLQGATGAPF